MDERVKLLRRVCRSRWFPSMAREALKLYLLLVVSTVRVGQEGRISWQVLKKALGASLMHKKVDRLAKALKRYGLADVRVIARSGRGRGPGRRADLEVRFTVFEFGVARGRSPGGLRQQGKHRDA